MKHHSWWLSAAISDDKLVADLLLRLKDTSSTTTTTTTTSISSPHHLYITTSLPPTWGLRHPRSSLYNKPNSPHRSPTTPLSYSSLSDHSSAHPSDLFRSKISTSTETPSTLTKRCKRKKAFGELREDTMSSLIKERTYLNKELETTHATMKEKRSMNVVSLKRMKFELHRVKSEANFSEPEEQTTNRSGGTSSEAGSSTSLLRQIKSEDGSEPDSGSSKRGVGTLQQQPGFVLPDLNMMPDEECIVGSMS